MDSQTCPPNSFLPAGPNRQIFSVKFFALSRIEQSAFLAEWAAAMPDRPSGRAFLVCECRSRAVQFERAGAESGDFA
jgi:hypothetical protein